MKTKLGQLNRIPNRHSTCRSTGQPGAMYLLSGVRPSSGAASFSSSASLENFRAIIASDVAAPGDGRTPLSGYAVILLFSAFVTSFALFAGTADAAEFANLILPENPTAAVTAQTNSASAISDSVAPPKASLITSM